MSWLTGWLVLLSLWAGPLGAAQDTAGDLVSRMVALSVENADGQRNALEALYQQLAGLPKPAKGDRQKARKANEQGLAAFKASQYDQAKQYFLQARKDDPANAEIADNLGLVHLKLGDFTSAGQTIAAALALVPNRGATWGNFAAYYAQQDRSKEAVAAYALMLLFAENPNKARSQIEYAAANADDPRTRQAAVIALQEGKVGEAQTVATASVQESAPSPIPQSTLPAMPAFPLAPLVKPSPSTPTARPSPSSPSPLPTSPPSNPDVPTASAEAAPPAIDYSGLAKWLLIALAVLFSGAAGFFVWRRYSQKGKTLALTLAERVRQQAQLRRYSELVGPPGATSPSPGPAPDMTSRWPRWPSLGVALVVFLLAYPLFPRWWSAVLAIALVVALVWWHRAPSQRQTLIDFMTGPTAPRFIAAGVLILGLVAGFFIGPKGGATLFCGTTLAASVFRAWHSRRRTAWLMAMYYSVLAFIAVWLLGLVVDDVTILFQPSSSVAKSTFPSQTYYGLQPPFSDLATTFGKPATGRTASLVLNLWAFIGTLGLAIMGADPRRWIHPKGIAWGFFALFLVAGRPIVYWANVGIGWLDSTFGLFPITWQLISAPLLLIPLGSLIVIAPLLMFSSVFFFFVGPVVFVFNQIMEFRHNLIIYRYQRSGLISYLVRFGYWLRGEPLPDVPDDSKGARFATPQEAVALNHPDGAVFGSVNGAPLCLRTDKHVLLMASTRSGKGVSLIIPHLLRYRGSAFVLDPKGENARATGRCRAVLNDQVHYLDPFGLTGQHKSRFNPLARFTPENMEAESKALAAALVMGEGAARDHWTSSAQQLLAALILYVYASPDVPPDKKDLPTVRRLLLGAMTQVLESMTQSDLADGLLADLGASFLKTPEKEFGSILSTAQRETEILDNPFIAASLAATGPGREVEFAAWHRGTMTVYLCLSAPKFPVFNRWLRLVLTSALDEMTDRLQPPPQPVCFMLDELATLGHLQAVENAVGLAAGYGIQLWNVFQDVAQMRDLYKGRWASFVGNADVRALFNLDDYETADYWSKTIGGHLVPSTSYSQNIYGLTQGQTSSETFRPLLTPEDIMRQFAAGQMLVLPQGSFPIVAQRVPYFQDQGLAGLWDDPRPPGAGG